LQNQIRPLFIFSLPRTGSTLLQRILASHKKISTVSEPWILLPYVYTLKYNGITAEYDYKLSVQAIKEFCKELPNGSVDYLNEIKKFVLMLYSKVSKNGTTYFLDKTPRYHLIVDDIIKLFPEGKFIFLWRIPFAVVASIIETWMDNKWNLHYYKIDLYKGFQNLFDALQNYREKSFSLQFEQLITNPDEMLEQIFDYLELSFNKDNLNNFSEIQLKGRLGDSLGIRKYNSINQEPLDKWKLNINTPFRKQWCRQYLKWIGAERLNYIGYDINKLTDELNNIPITLNTTFVDVFEFMRSKIKILLSK